MNTGPQPDPLQRLAWVFLWAFVFSLPWEKSLWVPGVGTISRLAGLLALGAGVAAVARRRSARLPNVALVLAAVFVIWTAASYFWSIAPAATAARAWTFVQLLGMTWLIWEFCRSPAQVVRLVQAYVLGTVLPAADTILRYLHNQETYYRRYAAAGFEPNDLGLTLALSLPLSLYLALRARGPIEWGYRAIALLAISAILLTASRTALIVSLLAFGFVLFTWRRSGLRHRIASAALLGLLLLGALRLAPAASRERLATLPEELAHGTLHRRTVIWKAGLSVLKRHPVLGFGAGAYPEAVRPLIGKPALPGHEYVAHNAFLSVAVECGLIGFGLFAAMLAAQALFVWMMPFVERALWAVMLAAWAAGVSTLSWEHRKVSWLIFALVMSQWAAAFRRPDEKA